MGLKSPAIEPCAKEGVTPFLECARAGNCAFMMRPPQEFWLWGVRVFF